MGDAPALIEDGATRLGGRTPVNTSGGLGSLSNAPPTGGAKAEDVVKTFEMGVWTVVWGEVKSRPTYRSICDEYDRYYDSVVEKLCAEIIEEGGYTNITAAAAAEALTCMTNGLWLSCLISPKDFDRDIAWNAIMSYLGNVFPRHYETAT